MLRHYMQTWRLAAPQHLTSTATSHVYTVQHHGDTVILKLLTPVGQEDEQGAAAALTWFASHGAIRLLRSDAHALLLEYVGSCTPSLRIILWPQNRVQCPHLKTCWRGQHHGLTPFLLPTRSVGPCLALRHVACHLAPARRDAPTRVSP